MDETAAARKKKQRESTAKWLRENEGVSLDALGTALRNGWARLVWIKRPVKKRKNDKVSRKKKKGVSDE